MSLIVLSRYAMKPSDFAKSICSFFLEMQNYLVQSSRKSSRTFSLAQRQQYSLGMAVAWKSPETARSNTLLKKRQ